MVHTGFESSLIVMNHKAHIQHTCMRSYSPCVRYLRLASEELKAVARLQTTLLPSALVETKMAHPFMSGAELHVLKYDLVCFVFLF